MGRPHSRRERRTALAPGFAPLATMLAADAVADGAWVGPAWAAAVAAWAAWSAFTGWRGWRLVRASALRGDRAYDRGGRLDLPAEYAATRSATAARKLSGCRRFD